MCIGSYDVRLNFNSMGILKLYYSDYCSNDDDDEEYMYAENIERNIILLPTTTWRHDEVSLHINYTLLYTIVRSLVYVKFAGTDYSDYRYTV